MKKRKIGDKFLILIPAFWACLVDLILTVINQPASYWDGNLQMANEGNPLLCSMMKSNIFGVFIFVTFWLLSIVTISFYLPSKLLKMFSLFVLIAHTFGSSSWLAVSCGFWTVINYVLLNSIIFIVFEDIYLLKLQKCD